MLKIQHLSKSFGDKKILNDISFEVSRGGIAVLLGRSGVGKSTLLRVLCSLETVDSGTLSFNGKPIVRVTPGERHPVGMVFQNFNLFSHMNVITNITFPLEKILHLSPAEAEKRALLLLKKYGLDEKKHVSVSRLSGGQKQRLAIARTIALRPEVICFDEPTSALDPSLTNHLVATLQELATEGFTLVIASHDVEILKKLSCSVFLLNKGMIVEQAFSEQLAKNYDSFPLIKKFVEGAEHHGIE